MSRKLETLPALAGHLAFQSKPDPVLDPAGKAEEKMEGTSQSPRRDACVETPGRPGLGTTQGGRGGVIGRGRGLPVNSGT